VPKQVRLACSRPPMPDKKEIVHGSRRTRLVVALALFAIVIFLSVALSRVFFRDYALKKEIARLQNNVRVLEDKKMRSLELLEYVKTDSYVESHARMKFGMVKDGEEVVIFNADPGTTMGSTGDGRAGQLTNGKKWWYYFFAPRKQ